MSQLMYGLITGFLFGFLLQKGRVLRFEKQINALLFKDLTIIKFMLSSVVVAMVGTYLLVDLELAKLSIKTTILGANIIGGLLFGLGWGVLGYCPGTSIGAVAEGRWDALWGVLGMLAGAALYAEVFPAMKTTILTWGNMGKVTLPQLLGINHWFMIVPFVVGTLFLFRWIEKKEL
ncbi:MAG: YeeE/YedE family protein [Trichlorobacter sp.]|uniref:DUF6691 family protein n=1 Tax=Trichlorobacter sp. TaxID=2911007 RepID=UPI00256C1B8D|nr:DUF6691 family protein [Trichlorobacter sp.]MDK9716861.1 YeeE/YedE family protein [Trichlorobacter sp.]